MSFNWIFSRNLWERPLFDLWSIPHLISGAFVAVAVRNLRINIWIGFLFSLVFAVAWEIAEIAFSVADVELWSNQISDVVLAQVGYFAGVLFFNKGVADEKALKAVYYMGIVYLTFAFLGFVSYLQYAS